MDSMDTTDVPNLILFSSHFPNAVKNQAKHCQVLLQASILPNNNMGTCLYISVLGREATIKIMCEAN